MPYRPGLPLDHLITKLDPGAQPKKAIVIWKALVEGTRDSDRQLNHGPAQSKPHGELGVLTVPKGDGWEGFPVGGPYAQGVAWITMILARALHYAHRMNTFHRDVKPGNVLVTLQHGPQLLDFNLAESPHSAEKANLALHGGTLPYMAPEQIEAFINPDLWDKVNAKADIYSLGLVLRELLTGHKPEVPSRTLPAPRALSAALVSRSFLEVDVRRFNPSIPPSLQAIVAKCLTLSQDDRYADAEALEHDLDRFLKYQPLKDAGNPSRREQVNNWLRRSRRMLTCAACLVLVCTAIYGLWRVRPGIPPKGPGIETTSEFRSAVADIKAERFSQANVTLEELEKKEPHNCLVLFHHSAARDGLARKTFEDNRSRTPDQSLLKSFDVKNYLMRDALKVPGAPNTLFEWAKDHSEALTYLVDFADSRIQDADAWNEIVDSRSAMPDGERDRLTIQLTYEAPRDALAIAIELDPKSAKIQRLMARTEFVLAETPAHFTAAYNRLSNVIESLRGENSQDVFEVFLVRTLHSEVAIRWAEQQRKDHAVDNDTLKRMRDAVNELRSCAQGLNNQPFNPDDDLEAVKRKYYHNLHDQLRATVTLAEVEMDLSDARASKAHLLSCEQIHQTLLQYTTAYNLKGKVPATDDLAERINKGYERLQEMGIATSRSSSETRSKSGQPG
jgi:serine/threonine protein kinase